MCVFVILYCRLDGIVFGNSDTQFSYSNVSLLCGFWGRVGSISVLFVSRKRPMNIKLKLKCFNLIERLLIC